jgi:hypothetical protein
MPGCVKVTEAGTVLGIPVTRSQDPTVVARTAKEAVLRVRSQLEVLKDIAKFDPQCAHFAYRRWSQPLTVYVATLYGDSDAAAVAWEGLRGETKRLVNALLKRGNDELDTPFSDEELLMLETAMPIAWGGLGIVDPVDYAPAIARKTRAKRLIIELRKKMAPIRKKLMKDLGAVKDLYEEKEKDIEKMIRESDHYNDGRWRENCSRNASGYALTRPYEVHHRIAAGPFWELMRNRYGQTVAPTRGHLASVAGPRTTKGHMFEKGVGNILRTILPVATVVEQPTPHYEIADDPGARADFTVYAKNGTSATTDVTFLEVLAPSYRKKDVQKVLADASNEKMVHYGTAYSNFFPLAVSTTGIIAEQSYHALRRLVRKVLRAAGANDSDPATEEMMKDIRAAISANAAHVMFHYALKVRKEKDTDDPNEPHRPGGGFPRLPCPSQ